jgi:hypothetical protein
MRFSQGLRKAGKLRKVITELRKYSLEIAADFAILMMLILGISEIQEIE